MCDVSNVSSKCKAGVQVFFCVSKWPSATVTWFGEQICFLWTTPPARCGSFGFRKESGVNTDHSHASLKGSMFLHLASSERTSFSLLSSVYLCRYVISSVQREIGITFLPHAMISSIYYYTLPYTAFLQFQKLHEGGFVWEHTSWKAVHKAGCIINHHRSVQLNDDAECIEASR